MAEQTEVELTIWITPLLNSWLQSKAFKGNKSRHRFVEEILATAMERERGESAAESVLGS